MIENTNTKQFYPGPILNNTLEITDFLFNDAEQIKIKHSKLDEEGVLRDVDLDYPTDYEVTKILPSDINAEEAALTASTGQVLLKNVNVLAGEKLTVYRVSQIIQDKDYPHTGAFPAASHEGALDYLTMQNQEQQEQINRSLKIPNSVETFNAQMPTPLPARALKINADGTGFEMSEFDPDIALITTEEFKNQAQQAAIEAHTSQNVAVEQANIATEQAGIATEQATIATQQAGIATEQAGIATEQATIATNKTSEVVESANTALSNIDTAKDNAITSITNQETTSKISLIDEGATQIGLIQNEGATQIANVQSTGFYMRDDKLYFINSQGEETEFKSGGATRNIGEIVASTIPLVDAGLHLLDGSLISGNGIYSDFVNYISTLDLTANYFCTEAEWQQSVTDYGVCGKFVYDSVNNTVRLPKYNSKIYTGGGTAPVVGNGMTLGLTNGTQTMGLSYSGNVSYGLWGAINSYGSTIGSTPSGDPSASKTIGITTDHTNSGIIAQLSNITTSLDGYYYIVIATSTKTDIQVDIDEIATDLNGKADVDLTNVNDNGKINIVKNNLIAYGVQMLTIGASGSTYTMPFDGLLCLEWRGPSISNYPFIQISSNKRNQTIARGHTFSDLGGMVSASVEKGDVITLAYGSDPFNLYGVFYIKPFIGSESEAN